MSPAARAWLRRLARSTHRDALVLRGSLLTCQWCPERPAPDDVDLVQRAPFDALADAQRIVDVAALDVNDGVVFAVRAAACQVIWAESSAPGVRVWIPCDEEVLRIDAASGDPIDPPPLLTVLDGVGAAVMGVRPETMLTWKVHGLVEFGRGQWRAKDLVDAWLLATRLTHDEDALRRALRLAFESRFTPLEAARALLYDDTWGLGRSSRRKWRTWLARRSVGLPTDFTAVRDALRAAMRPRFEALGIVTAP